MRILVTGASGYIGGNLIEALCEKDWVETVIGTDIREPAKNHAKYTFDKRDVRESMDDIFDAERIDTVVHTAYVLPPIHDTGLMEDINKRGTKNVLASAVRAGVQQILYTSSTTAYGFHADNDDPLTETSPLRGNDDFTYAKNKKEIERIFDDFIIDRPDITVSIVRPCYVIGPGIANPLSTHLKKKFVVFPSNARPWQFVHEDDLRDVLVMLIEKQIGGIYNIAGSGSITFNEMIRMLGNIPVPIPWPLLYVANDLAWRLRLSFITEFPSPAMRMMVHPWIADSKKLITETGYRYRYSSREAFESFARSVKESG